MSHNLIEYPFTSSEVESIYYLPDGNTSNVIILRALYTPSFLKTLKTNPEVDGIFIFLQRENWIPDK